MTAQEIVWEALDLPAGERGAFVEEQCAGDQTLREEVFALLAQHSQAEEFFEKSTRPIEEFCEIIDAQPGDRIGPYVLREWIGEGGFGVVWKAEQIDPIKRVVALKLIKPGMDTREVLARFAAERQALARMEHPNIARVLDAGATQAGRPYFVMELVDGLPITEFCAEHQLSIRDRIALVSWVCEAIGHAHQRGIIHRDIKPSNVLVAGKREPVVKVIDFGVAKAMEGKLTEVTLHTMVAQMVGTPSCMSPEQASADGIPIDARTDVYGIGALLYELLCGVPPFDFSRKDLLEIRRIVREVEPARPSARLLQIPEKRAKTIAQNLQLTPRTLRKALRPELDWIVLKCLEKNPNRRYDSTDALVSDLIRFHENKPVVARPPTGAYVAGKFLRRHRTACIAAAVVTGLLAVSVLATAWITQQSIAALLGSESSAVPSVSVSEIDRASSNILAQAGERWTEEEEARLLEAFHAGESVPALAARHLRTEAAIHARLKRLLEPAAPAVSGGEASSPDESDIESLTTSAPWGPRRLEELLDLDAAPVLVEDAFEDSRTGFFFTDPEADVYLDGRPIIRGSIAPAWSRRMPPFHEAIACELTAQVTDGEHRGWGVIINEHEGEEPFRGIEVLLDTNGQLRILPGRWGDSRSPVIVSPPPIQVANFRPQELNRLTAILTENRKLAVFVNGVEVMPPIELPFEIEPSRIQLASAGGRRSSTVLAFDHFRVVSAEGVDVGPTTPVGLLKNETSPEDSSPKSTPPEPKAVDLPASFAPRSLDQLLEREPATILVEDNFDAPEAGWFFREGLRDNFHDGRLIFRGSQGGAWASRHLEFQNFACEVVAKVTNGRHRGWGMMIYHPAHTPGTLEEPHVGVEVLLDGEGNLSLVPSRYGDKDNPNLVEIAPVDPVRVENFKPNEFNTLAAVFLGDDKLAIFVNGKEALPALKLPFRMQRPGLQLATGGGVQTSTVLEFDSFRVFDARQVDLGPTISLPSASTPPHPDHEISQNPIARAADAAEIPQPPAEQARAIAPTFQPRPLSTVLDRKTAKALLEDDFTDPRNRRFLSKDTKEAYQRHGVLVVEPGHFIGLPERPIAFENFAAEIVAKADYAIHRCWGVHLYGRPGPPGNPNNPQVGFRVSLESNGTLRVIPDRSVAESGNAQGWPDIEPIVARGFLPEEFNTLTVVFTEGHKLAVFVNDLEAISPASVPIRLEPASVKFVACGGGDAPSARVEFDSLRIFTGIDLAEP